MSKQANRKPISIVLGAAIATSLGASGIANAKTGSDIFSIDELTSGYLTAGGHKQKSNNRDGEKNENGKDGQENGHENGNKDGNKGGKDGKGGEGSCGGKGGEGACGGSGA
jgi:hypothetical protein